MKHMTVTFTLSVLVTLIFYLIGHTEQTVIDRVEQMPNHPSPYLLRDWKKVARDYDAFVFDFTKTGQYLPLIWWDTTRIHFDRDGFGMPSYVGRPGQTGGNAHESINCMGAVLGATLIGIDKSNQNGYNWVLMLENYFSRTTGENLYLNNIPGDTGQTFWYELFPNILFFQIHHYYPGVGNMDEEFRIVADRWYDACVAMGGSVEPWSVPNFNHTAFDFDTMTPYNNGSWLEPDSAAAVAWLEYMAYVETGDSKYLTAADWSMQFLESRGESPLYDVLFCFAPYIAVRMNHEANRNYDVDKFIRWCFDGNRHGWGVLAANWGGLDSHGLTSNDRYAFEMETLNFAAALTPLVRYEDRYARAIGKYILNLANSTRLFYSNAHAADHQTSYDWASTYDPDACIAYEGLKKEKLTYNHTSSDYSTRYGLILSGNHTDTHTRNNVYEVLVESTLTGPSFDALEHVWEIFVGDGYFFNLVVKARQESTDDADEGFRFSYASSPEGPYSELFTVTAENVDEFQWTSLIPSSATVYLKVEDTDRTPGNFQNDKLFVDEIWIETRDNNIAPYASGDPLSFGWGNTDLGLYGSGFVGILGGIVTPTNVEKILQLDLLKTDYYHDLAYPTYLYFNPYDSPKVVSVNIGSTTRDLYDCASNVFLATGVSGEVGINIPGDSAIVLVMTPPGSEVSYRGNKMLIDSRIVDYSRPPEPYSPDPYTALLLHLDGNLFDSSPNNYPCQFSSISGYGNPIYSSSLDQFGESLYGDGGDTNGVQIADASISVEHPSPLTIEAWINIPSSKAGQDFTNSILDLAAGRLVLYVHFSANGTVRPQLVVWNGASYERNECTITPANGWYYDEWHHIAVTYDSNQVNSPVSFYFNGRKMPIEPSGGDPLITSEYEKVPLYGLTAGRLWLPNAPTQNLNPLIGYIDEIRLSTIVRYPAQMQSAVSGWNLY